MSERIANNNPEALDRAKTLEHASSEEHERVAERLKEAAEKVAEKNLEKAADTARNEALERAQQTQQKTEITPESKESKHQITKVDREVSYKNTMAKMQSKLSPTSRAFSKVIHNPAVEKTSEVVGNTIVRPNLVIAGALGAIASVIVYFIAKHYGYVLSGSETIFLFIGGWLIGAVIEYARVGFSSHKK